VDPRKYSTNYERIFGMSEVNMRKWIDNASYTALLRRWRFEPVGSPWFQDELGEYFSAAMARAREKTPHDEQIQASKDIGWDE
jgi:hypothetical protein